MNTLPIRLYPGFFNQKSRSTEHRLGSYVSTSKTKPTVTIRPSNPRAIHMMPVLAIVAAVGSIIGGVAAVGAATGIIGTVLAGAMIVGGAATLIGVATGNQNLVKYGGILAIAGGIGLAGMNLLGETSMASSQTAGLSNAANPPMADMAGPSVAQTTTDAITQAAAPSATQTTSGVLNAVGGPGDALTGPTASNAAQASPSVATPTPATPPAAAPWKPDISDAYAPGENPQPFQSPNIPVNVKETPQGFFNQIGQWIENNPKQTDVISGAAKGLFGNLVASPTQQSEINLNSATANYRTRAAALAAQRADWGSGISKPLSYYLGS